MHSIFVFSQKREIFPGNFFQGFFSRNFYLQFHDVWNQKFKSQNVKNEKRVQFKPDITTIFTSSLLQIKMALILQVQLLTIKLETLSLKPIPN